jgi:hypothetical protein
VIKVKLVVSYSLEVELDGCFSSIIGKRLPIFFSFKMAVDQESSP